MRKLWGWFLCNVLEDHQWTCKNDKGIPPDKEKMKAEPYLYMLDYMQGWCKRCRRRL